jgi:glycosyltransferase involved in cell wall biosynthesis
MPTVAIIGTRGYPSYYGGFETAVRHLAPYLSDHGWNVRVYNRPGAVKKDDPRRDPRVETVVTKGLESKSASTLTFGLSAVLHACRHAPDVALVMNVANGYWLPLLKLRGIPTLTNVDGIEWDRDKWSSFAKRVFHFGARLTRRFSDGLVFDAREIERRWAEEFRAQGVFIPYGGDRLESVPVEEGLQHRKYALFVARFVPENTLSEFLDAVPAISASYDVVLVGSSGHPSELENRVAATARENPRVHWLGHVSDDLRLHSLWQHAGAYFHGHSVGGTNPALVQAMASGAPIVARDTPYNREVLGDAGLCVSPQPSAIAAAMLRLLDDDGMADRLSQDGIMRFQEAYSWDGVNSAYSDELARLIRPDRRSPSTPNTAPFKPSESSSGTASPNRRLGRKAISGQQRLGL